jgi:Domain of unknown function (DUF6134)
MQSIIRHALCWLWLAGAATAHAAQWQFDVFLDGRRIGEHTFTIEHLDGDRYVAYSRARYEVKLLLVPVFRYRHESVEEWHGACLQEISSRTQVNGKQYRVDGEQRGDAFALVVAHDDVTETRSLPDCIATYAYWDIATLRQHTRLLNSQTGAYDPVALHQLPSELRIVGEHSERRFAIDLDYDDGRWAGLSTLRDGRALEYRLR